MRASRETSKQITFTARAKIMSGGEALEATTTLYGKMLTTTLSRLGKDVSVVAIEQELQQKFSVNRRVARAIIVQAEGMRAAVVDGAAARLVGVEERLWRLEKRIAKVKKKEPQQLRGLNSRLQSLRSRQARDQALVDGSIQPSVCLGTKKLFKARQGIENPEKIAAWREQWERGRTSQVFFPGERDRASGNNECTLRLGDGSTDNPDQLIIRTPKSVYEATGQPVVTLSLKGLGYARQHLQAALAPDYEHLERRQEAHEKGEPARKGGKVAKSPPVSLACKSPLSVRIWVDSKGILRVALTVLRAIALPDVTSDISNGAVGIDVNPDHLAVCRINVHGNPVIFKKFPIMTTGSSGQRSASIHRAVNCAVKLAQADPSSGLSAVPVISERLNFGCARTNLRYLPAKLSVKLSSFAYSAILKLIAVRAANLGLESISVSPAYTSILGQANYAAPYGVSTDLAAACAIARRGKNHKEQIRPNVLARAPEDARTTTRSPSQKRAALRVRLPKRSETYSCSWLARDLRASAKPSDVDGTLLLGTVALSQRHPDTSVRADVRVLGRTLDFVNFDQV